MRIIAGQLGGRIFQAPTGNRTHPMSDKMRGALFNILGDINGLIVLDAFAGSGALSFEAVSRGASHVTAIDNDATAQRTITENIITLNVADQIKLIKANIKAWLNTTNQTYDLILVDPPYDKLQEHVLNSLVSLLEANGTMVLSWPGKQTLPMFVSLVLKSRHDYGDSQLAVYKLS